MNPMGLHNTVDPFLVHKLQQYIHINMLLNAQQQRGSATPPYNLPPAVSPPLKLPFGGLSHPLFSNAPFSNSVLTAGLDDKKTSMEMMRLKAKHSENS